MATTSTAPLKAHHLYIVCPGATREQVMEFYQHKMGLTPYPKPASLAHIPVEWFEAGAIKFHVGYLAQGVVGTAHTALAVADVATARREMGERGCIVDNNVIDMGYDRFYVRDPWENQFEILPDGLP